MGGFIYKDLYSSLEGQKINWFNGQFYGNFSTNTYSAIIKNGYPENKVVMGMLSDNFLDDSILLQLMPSLGSSFEDALQTISAISKNYKQFGGVFVWEYFNCPPNNIDHSVWAKEMNNAFVNNSNCYITSICYKNFFKH